LRVAFIAAAALALTQVAAATAEAPRARPPSFSRVVVVVFENKEVDEVAGSRHAPTFNRLAVRGARLAPYTAVTHPSLPNYLALVSGSTHGIDGNCTTCVIDAPSLANTLHAAGRTWKAYAEGLPARGFTGAASGRYVKRHVPFLYFRAVLSRPSWRRRVQPLRDLARDLAAQRLPDFSLVVPDLCHDMHDCPVEAGDAWLASWLPRLLRSPALRRGVVFVVFDEGATHVGGGGRVAGYAAGSLVRPHARTGRPVTHYRVLATIEAAWRLPLLGETARARPITGIWR
jgi:phosphatidylinositol-3-phosphatase